MTTAVASPPSFQPLTRLGWNGGNTTSSGGFTTTMSTDEVSRMFMPQRKVVQRSNSSSSIASTGSTSSTVTVTHQDASTGGLSNGEASQGTKKKPRGGFWPASKAESTSGVTSVRANGSLQTVGSNSGKSQLQPALPSQNSTTPTNGARSIGNQPPNEPTAILALLPMNGTFERKQINVPFFPDVLRVGRQTNAKTVPTPVNGFFDSKVLSRQHAEVWAERNGKVCIKDVKSSNGTFVNGQRLSPENRESDPHELHQHDTLELGIDIVSEDQKTIVHHKVSAKVEYVGLPGTSNDVLSLNFGDLDPSHGGTLLSSPLSAPMVHSRSRPGGPVTNPRSSTPSSIPGSQISSMAQQRQLNFWGAPLNVEQLVKTLTTEMRVAKQQSLELEQAGTFLNAVLTPDSDTAKAQAQTKEGALLKQLNGRVKAPKVDHLPRFADPPAPPPQQPLPDKPADSTKSSPVNQVSFTNFLKRSDTTKPGTSAANSPTHSQNSQMLALIEALSVAKQELDSQGARVKELEDMLKQERSAREDAEARAERLEEHASARPLSNVESVAESSTSADDVTESKKDIPSPADTHIDSSEEDLQHQLENVVAEMQKMKIEMDKYQKRAEIAEDDANKSRASLTDMILKLRKEDEEELLKHSNERNGSNFGESDNINERTGATTTTSMKPSAQANGHIGGPKLPESIERAMASILRHSNATHGDMAAQSAPYISMFGIVCIGIGLMTYLNTASKSET